MTRLPARDFYVRAFDSGVNDASIIYHTRKLTAALDHRGLKYEQGWVVAAAYSHTLHGSGGDGSDGGVGVMTHSEVWVQGEFDKEQKMV